MTLSTAANRTFAFVPALLSVSVFVLSAVCPDAAWAGTSTGGQEHFADLYAMLKAWSTGTLGKSIALMFLLVGLGVGVIRGSIMAPWAALPLPWLCSSDRRSLNRSSRP